MEALYRDRNWFASGPSFLLFVAAIVLTAQHKTTPPKPKHEPPMRISIAQPQVEPPPPMPEMPAIAQPPTPDITLPAMEKFTPRQTPKPTPTPSAKPTPPTPPQEETSAVAPSAPVAPAKTAAPPAPAQPVAASQDDAYSAQVRTYLDSIKHYPTSKEARLQRPRGVVDVWFVLDRAGGMKEAGVENSSGSLILDGAALSLVRSASYPAFPPDAFPGQPTHRFTVHLNYTLT